MRTIDQLASVRFSPLLGRGKLLASAELKGLARLEATALVQLWSFWDWGELYASNLEATSLEAKRLQFLSYNISCLRTTERSFQWNYFPLRPHYQCTPMFQVLRHFISCSLSPIWWSVTVSQAWVYFGKQWSISQRSSNQFRQSV